MKKNALIGIWAGSSACKKEDFEKGLAQLKKLGLTPVVPKLTLKNLAKKAKAPHPFLAGKDEDKVKALLELIENQKIKNIFCVRGGYGNIRLLSLLDKEKITRRKPLKIWGYSDTTIIQHYFYQRKKWQWVHSPLLCSSSFHSPNRKEAKIWKGIVEHDTMPTIKAKDLHAKPGKSWKKAKHLLGGNLSCLVNLIGTPWEPKPKKPFYLFLEDIGESAYRIDRMLYQLHASKFMKNCQGILLGHLTNCPNGQKIVSAFCKEKKLYLAKGIEAGHQRTNTPILMG